MPADRQDMSRGPGRGGPGRGGLERPAVPAPLAIEIRGVTKTYGSGDGAVIALHETDLDVRSGEVLLLMGPSGSGKTTLLSIMGCILRPTGGSVRVAGIETAAMPQSRLPPIRLKHIGFVFQAFNLFPTLSVGENVEVALDLKGIRGSRARQMAKDLLADVGLADKFHTLPADISGGQKQRVALARALAGDPEVLLADEPTAALDSVTGRSVMDLMRSLAHDRGRAVVIVTHDNRILDMGDRIVHIEDGRIAREHDTRNTPPVLQPHMHIPETTHHRSLP